MNGTSKDKGDNQKLWGNIAARDMPKWQGIHALMRCDLAFHYNINFNNAAELLKLYQPCFLMPSGHINDQVYYPRTTKSMNCKYGLVGDNANDEKTVDFYYTTLPQYFLFTTNMKYNEANLSRIQIYMRNTEKYDGILKSNYHTDVENWRSHWDIGFSDHSGQDNTKFMYYCAHGNYNLMQFFPASPAYNNYTQYANSYPYFPYADKVDVLSTTRSDIPNKGYTQMIVEGDVQPNVANIGTKNSSNLFLQGLYNIQHSDYTTHHFKDNKNKDAGIAFYSRYDSSWQSKVNTDGLDTADLSFGDGSLSNQYNVGCYPVNMKGSKGPEYTYDLTDTYWKGYLDKLDPEIQGLKQELSYKRELGSDDDHKQHGGYSMYQWDDVENQWNELPDMYIYTANNMNVADGRDPLTGLVFDGNYPLDNMATEGKNWVVFDAANDRRFASLLEDNGDGTSNHMAMYYCEPGFNQTTNGLFPDDPPYHNFTPLGEGAFSRGGHYYDVQVTNMYILSDDPDDPHYWKDSHTGTGDHEPTGINHKQAEQISNQDTVCGFMLYRASATQNGADWDISTDFALPAMHQAQFCVSASFMDNPATWLVNAERFDDSKGLPGNDQENTNYIVVGANNPTFQYDNGLSRCTFKDLHIPKVLGVEDMPTKDGEVVQTTIGNWVVKVADTAIKYGYIWKFLDGSNTVDADTYTINSIGTNRNYLLNYSIGGISIDSMYGETEEANNTVDNMTLLTEDNWHNCLLYKLGFQYSDLFPKFGEPTNIYDYSKMNSTDPAVRYEKLKPLTTNPLIDISSATSLPVQDGTTTEPNPSDEDHPYEQVGMGLPTYSLSVGSLIPTNLDGQNSESIIASNLPIKQSTPYYTIYCSLSSGEYISNTDSYQILGVIQKRFIAGDFIYSDASVPMRVKINQKVTRIYIEIRDNAGKVVSLDDNNTVILRLDRAV